MRAAQERGEPSTLSIASGTEHADDGTLPVKPGDWVSGSGGRVAKVKSVYRGEDSGVLVDLVMYSRLGDLIGRESPAMDGETSYEPACSYAGWHRIPVPSFPIALKWIKREGGTLTAGYSAGNALPDRKWIPRQRPAADGAAPRPNLEAEPDARALLRAAQELRDAGRRHGIPEMADRAAELEAEAALLRAPLR